MDFLPLLMLQVNHGGWRPSRTVAANSVPISLRRARPDPPRLAEAVLLSACRCLASFRPAREVKVVTVEEFRVTKPTLGRKPFDGSA
jgi:hypothetical protein